MWLTASLMSAARDADVGVFFKMSIAFDIGLFASVGGAVAFAIFTGPLGFFARSLSSFSFGGSLRSTGSSRGFGLGFVSIHTGGGGAGSTNGSSMGEMPMSWSRYWAIQ